MPVTDICTNLLTAITSTTTTIRVPQPEMGEIVAAIRQPSHLIAELYTARYNEQIMIYSTEPKAGITYLTVQRGVGGTEARSWPDGACVRILRQIAGRPCGDPDEGDITASGALLRALLGMLRVGPELELLLEGQDAPLLRIRPTGVTPGDYGGAEFSATGQLLDAPPQWPASALPVFDVCCEPDGEGGTQPVDLSGLVRRINGIEPNAAGSVDLCNGTPSNTPVTGQTPVFICANGAIAKTSIAQIIELVEMPDIEMPNGVVLSVGGLQPDALGRIDFSNAAMMASLSGAYVLVDTPSGVRRVSPQTLISSVPSTPFAIDYEPINGNLELTIDGISRLQDISPEVDVSIVSGQLTVRVGSQSDSTPFTVPMNVTTEFDEDEAVLTTTVNGVSDTATINVFALARRIPVYTEAAATAPLYALVRDADGDLFWKLTT